MKCSLLRRHDFDESASVSIENYSPSNNGRPVLIHLNADTTWLLRVPRHHRSEKGIQRSFFNILIDPWLQGRQSDVAFWFSSQWHAIKASVQTISALNTFLAETEEGINDDSPGHLRASGSKNDNYVDVVVVSHEFTDHCHKATLLEVDPDVPIFATAKAAQLIKSWNHFRTVQEPAAFSAKQLDWRITSHDSLPKWVGISRIVSETDALYYHSAIMICFDMRLADQDLKQNEGVAEAVIYTPHGIQAQDLACLEHAHPRVKTLALMHGLHDVKISSKQLNLGAHNGLQAQRICGARYWVSTHDEVKKARGFIAPMLHRKQLTFKDALDAEVNRGFTEQSSDLSVVRDVNFAEMKSGQSLTLN